MMNWIDQKYIQLISPRLRNFKKKSSTLYNFSCPICNDSHTNKLKARGYIYEKKGVTVFYCHNCGISHNLGKFIKNMDMSLYDQYVLERLKDDKSYSNTFSVGKTKELSDIDKFAKMVSKPSFMKTGVLKGLKKVSQLSHTDPVKVFCVERKIPNKFHAFLFSCPNFFKFTNSIIPEKFSQESIQKDETRLLIPFFNKNKEVFGYQGRSIRSNSSVKYITIMIDNNYPKIYGLDLVDDSKKYYCFEGPIDSMFVENSIASGGGDIISSIEHTQLNKDNCVICYDNEPRSSHTVKKIEKAIDKGYSVFIWPQQIAEKDVNDVVKTGKSLESVQKLIEDNTFTGLKAKMQLGRWKKT